MYSEPTQTLGSVKDYVAKDTELHSRLKNVLATGRVAVMSSFVASACSLYIFFLKNKKKHNTCQLSATFPNLRHGWCHSLSVPAAPRGAGWVNLGFNASFRGLRILIQSVLLGSILCEHGRDLPADSASYAD